MNSRGSHLCVLVAGAEQEAAQRSVARAAETVAQMVEYILGSRVDDYAPLFDLNARLCAMEFGVCSMADGEFIFGCSLLPALVHLCRKGFSNTTTVHSCNRRDGRCPL